MQKGVFYVYFWNNQLMDLNGKAVPGERGSDMANVERFSSGVMSIEDMMLCLYYLELLNKLLI